MRNETPNSNSNKTFTVTGFTKCRYSDTGKPERTPGVFSRIEAELTTQNPEEAKEIAKSFPKSYQVRGSGVRPLDGSPAWGSVRIRAELSGDGVNGGKNESGIKRFKRFLTKVPHVFAEPTALNFATIKELNDLLER
ncbi:MAG TPA: hypothetical protein HPP54_10795 [Nitrospinae bacterium]|nr:hypothetical protein [Nitrospinota bacterium]